MFKRSVALEQIRGYIKENPDSYESLLKKERELQYKIRRIMEHFNSPIYNSLYHDSIQYMESKLEMPKEAFKPPLNMFQKLHGKLSKSEIMVMYAILGICALSLWCALLFGVAFKK